MTASDHRETKVKREEIKDSVRNALWARTAGRCTICNRRLLGDSRTYLHSVLLAELAHNIGATDSPGSPRRKDNDGVDDTEAEENLLLLCHDCHKIIDHPDHIDFFPPEKLREIKESFERRIEMVTENGGLTRTAALRVGSHIRGSLALASQREIAETLLAGNYLGLVETQRSGDFTCRIHGSADGRGYWDSAQQSIDDTLALERVPWILWGGSGRTWRMFDRHDLTDAEWARLELLLPDRAPCRGGRWMDHRQVINAVLWRTRAGASWRDVPAAYGNWKTIYNRHYRWAVEGVWAGVLDELRRGCDEAEGPDWSVAVDGTVVRAHQHAAGARHTPPAHLDTGG
jgi:transposase/5-methylcytosine-specific restriction endonuclease McrA